MYGLSLDKTSFSFDSSENEIQNDEITPIFGAVINDTENYYILKQCLENYGINVYDSLSDIPIPEGSSVDDYKIKMDIPSQEELQKTSEYTEKEKLEAMIILLLFGSAEAPHSMVYALDLRNASNLKEISTFSFAGTQINEIKYPDKLEKIGAYSFMSCQISKLDLSSIPNLKEIGEYAFYGNNIVGPQVISSSIKKIGDYAFTNNSITELDLSNASSLEELSGFNNNHITSVDLSGAINLKKLGDYAFSSNQISGEIYISPTIETVGHYAFDSNQITSLNLSEATNLKFLGGFGDNQLTTLDLSNATKIETIDDRSFWHNNISGNIDLSNLTNLKEIEEYAFYGMNITGTIVINSKVEKIGYQSFQSNKISSLDLSNANSLTTIDKYAFSGNEITGEVIFPSNVITINEYAFSGNEKMYANINNATSLKTIGKYAFNHTSQPSSSADPIIIQSNVETIGERAFDYYSISGFSFAVFDLTQAKSLKSIGYHGLGWPKVIDVSTRTKEDFESNVTLDNNWYYMYSGNSFELKYSDVTCDYSGTCTANT